MLRFFALFCSLISLASGSPLLNAKRILFLGDSITYNGIHLANLETYLTLAHPDPKRVLLNLGLSSETVSGLSEEGHAGGKFPRPNLHERLTRVLTLTQPDLIVACYGINCAIYQPFDQVRFRKYQEGLTKLRNEAARHDVPITFLTPWPYDSQAGNANIPSDYDSSVLRVYSDWILAQRQFGWQVVDTHQAMNDQLTMGRAKDPKFALTKDGIHFNQAGDWAASQILLNLAGAGNPPSLEAMLAPFPDGKKVHQETITRMKTQRDDWLRKTKHLRPGAPGGPSKK